MVYAMIFQACASSAPQGNAGRHFGAGKALSFVVFNARFESFRPFLRLASHQAERRHA